MIELIFVTWKWPYTYKTEYAVFSPWWGDADSFIRSLYLHNATHIKKYCIDSKELWLFCNT